jgi:hypothetical protein
MPEDAPRVDGADRRRAASIIRKRQSTPSRAAEITVLGLEGLVPMDLDATRRGEVSESLASGAKATREIIGSIAAIQAATKEQDEDDSDYEITIFALKKRKEELLSQLEGSDEHDN